MAPVRLRWACGCAAGAGRDRPISTRAIDLRRRALTGVSGVAQVRLSRGGDRRFMTTPPLTTGGNRPDASLFALGAGWVWPAVLVALFVSLIYLPAHAEGANATDELVATIAGLYIVAMSAGLVRLVRGGVLRLAGSGEPIVVLGRGPEPMLDARIRARWRLAAIGAGAFVAVTAVVAAALLGGTTAPATYAHALTNLTLGVNLALAGGVMVPVPGFTGWALLLAIVDAAGAKPDQRVRRAAGLARALGIPIFASLGVAAVFLGDPMLMLLGFFIAFFIGAQSRLAIGQDAIARFLNERVVGDLARPIASHAEADESVDAVVARLPVGPVVTAVETSGALIGALGPRQLAARDLRHPGQRASELMVPLAEVPLLRASMPAADVLPAIGRHGFALVRGSGGPASIEADDLLAQILAGLPARDRAADW